MIKQFSDYQKYIHKSRYARYLESEQRREVWEETVKRLCDYWENKFPGVFPYNEIYQGIVNMEVMPSMRTMMTAGKALDRDNVAGYNCSYVAIDDVRAFDEIMYILMCGTGVGFSVERQYIAKLPCVAEELHQSDSIIQIRDSKLGWATGFRELLALLYSGKVPKWDLSNIRKAGERLKTFGGRASGPGPLNELFEFTIRLFKNAVGRKLTSLECHDLVCKIADIVVVGGVRRSALISLSNLSDDRMRNAKNGQWWEHNPQRALANNSVAYTEKPDVGTFLKEWNALYESKSGERGLFNRVAAQNKAESTGRREYEHEFGTNPCGEIILRSKGFCNLSEVVARYEDTIETLKEKIRLATIIGCFQATLTNFRYLRKVWTTNAQEESLLGVSLTGIMDSPVLAHINDKTLVELKQVAIDTAIEWAPRLNISIPAAITTIKPSGTVSQLVDSSSGIHSRFSQYYIRTVRSDIKDPITDFLYTQGVPAEQDVINPQNIVFSFPQKAPYKEEEFSAIEQLEIYKKYYINWCEHNPSVTIYVKENEWLDVAAWVYKHFDVLGGVSFLPHTDHIYKQAPYQEITEQEYKQRAKEFPIIDWDSFVELEDNVVSYKELACVAGICEL